MKIDDLIIYETSSAEILKINELEDAYEELSMLAEVFETGDFGVLVNKRGRTLNYQDIVQIKKAIKKILKTNTLIRGSNLEHRDGDATINLMHHSIAHGFELAAMSALTIILAGGTAVGAATANPALAALSGAGGVATAAGVQSQIEDIKSIKAASKLLGVVDAFQNIRPKKKIRLSAWRRFVNFVTGKSKADIQKQIENKIQQAKEKGKKRFKRALGKMPEHIQYVENGIEYQVPVTELFD